MVKIGVVGLGGMGTVHLSNYEHIENVEVVAVCDLYAKRENFNEKINVYTNIDEMIKNEKLDLVDICTPTFAHKDSVLKALKNKINVICEKPITLKYDDAELMINTAKENNVKLFIAHVLQYSKEVIKLREIINENKYGKVIYGNFIRLSSTPKWVKNGWLFDKTLSGGIPYDLHIHDLDLIVSLFGNPNERSVNECKNELSPESAHYHFVYKYSDKTITSEASWTNSNIPFTAHFRVYFEKAALQLGSDGLTLYEIDKEPVKIDVSEDILIPTGINLPPTGMFYRELSDFVSSLDENYVGCKRADDILNVIKILSNIN